MKKIAITLFLITVYMVSITSCIQPAPVSEVFLQRAPDHQKIAILPYSVVFDENFKKNSRKYSDQEYWMEQQRLAGLDLQKSLFIYAADLTRKGKMEKVIQSFEVTNKLLAEAGINFFDIAKSDKGFLSRMLGVDAVIWGVSEVTADPMQNYMMMGRAGTELTSRLYDGLTGDLLWSKSLHQQPSRGENPKGLADELARQTMKMLPYVQ